MADSFDPYYQWLAIPPAEQPPDLYRLVGAAKYESNLDVLSYAVDQRMTHIRTFQVGKHVAESQKLLNELAHARLTLLDPDKKAEYDKKLHDKEHVRKDQPAKLAVAKPLPKAVPLAAPAPATVGVFPTVPSEAKPPVKPHESGLIKPVAVPAAAASPTTNTTSSTIHKRPAKAAIPGWMIAAISGGGVLLLGLVVIIAMTLGGGEKPIAKDPKPKPEDVKPEPIKPQPVKPEVKPEPVKPNPVKPEVPNATPQVKPEVDPTPPTTVGGRRAMRLTKDGSLEVENSANLVTLNRPFTVEAWARFELVGTKSVRVVGIAPYSFKVSKEDWRNGWQLFAQGNSWSIVHGTPTDNKSNTSGADVSKDWRHLAVVGTGSRLMVYLDGQRRIDEPIEPGPETKRTLNLFFGNPEGDPNAGFFELATVRVSTSARYTDNFTPEKAFGVDDQVVALYDLTKAQAGDPADLSNHHNHGRLNGSNAWVESAGIVASVKVPAAAARSVGEKKPVLRLPLGSVVEVADSADLATQDSPFTAEAWMRWTLDSATEPHFFGNIPLLNKTSPGNGRNGWSLFGSARKFTLLYGDENDRMLGHKKTFPASENGDNAWRHVAICGNGRQLMMYVDGHIMFDKPVVPGPRAPRGTNIFLGAVDVPPGAGRDSYFEFSAFRLSNNWRYKDEFIPDPVFEADSNVTVLYDLTKAESGNIQDLARKGHDGKLRGGGSWTEANDVIASVKAPTGGTKQPSVGTPGTTASTDSLDLLKVVDISKDVLTGEVNSIDGALHTVGNKLDFIQFNTALPREFILEATITRKSGDDYIGFGFNTGALKTIFCIDAYPTRGTFTGACVADGKFLYDPGYANAHRGALLTNNRPAKVRIAVTADSVKGWVDGKEVYQWQGDPTSLGIVTRMFSQTEAKLFLSVSKSPYIISEFKLLPYDVNGKPSTQFVGVDPATPAAPKQPVPDAAAIKQSRDEVRGILKDDYTSAKRPEDKLTLSKKVAKLARTTKDSPAMQYALWEEAWHLAVEGANIPAALELIDEEAQLFEMDVCPAKFEVIKTCAPLARTPAERRSVAEVSLTIAEEAVGALQFDLAEQAIRIAGSAAAKANDPKLKNDISIRDKQIDELKKQSNLGKQAAERLKTDPENAKANLAYGRFLCMIKGDWKTGLEHLKKGGDAALVAAIDADAAAKDNAGQIAAGDKWWDLSQSSGGDDKSMMLARAGYWYEQALPQLSGLSKERVAKRVKTIQETLPAGLLKGRGGASKKTIDLIRLIDPTRDTISGTWDVQDGVLLLRKGNFVPKIYLPYIPPEEYDVKMVFSQPAIRNDVAIVTPKGDASVCWMLGGASGKLQFNFDPNSGRPPIKSVPGAFVPDRKYTTVLQVRNEGVAAFVDGVQVAAYKTDYKDFRPETWHAIPDPKRMAVTADDPTIYYQIEVTEITGTGKILKQP